MSDYGFKTHDATNKVAINAKNPIFGFDMAHKPRAFKTFRITDAKTSPFHTASLYDPNPTPSNSWGYAENSDWGYVKELVKKVKHGYNFRPVGYATITGSLNTEVRVQITQRQRAGSYGGNYTLPLIKSQYSSQELTPNMTGHIWFPYTSYPSYAPPVATLTATDFANTTWAYEYPKSVMTMPYGPLYDPDYINQFYLPDPISVEIDDEYIYFYRTYLWSDTIRRAKFTYGGSTSDDIQERVKVSTQYTGSVYNITVYLCPFPIEELL